MKIFDPSILALPFFDDKHRALARRLEDWAGELAEAGFRIDGAEPAGERQVAEHGRRLIRLVGDNGWLAYAADPTLATAGGWPDFRSICLIREAFAFVDDLLDFAFSIQALACASLMRYGSEVLRRGCLDLLRSGRRIGSFALSEPEVGSNLVDLRCSAERQGDSFVLNGNKTWIANGSIADDHLVLARTDGKSGLIGLSFLAVSAEAEGVTVSHTIDTLAPRPLAALTFKDCTVPAENLLGKQGLGFQYALEILERFRITVGAAAIGFCRRAVREALGWSKLRTVQGKPLLGLQLTSEKIARMAVYLDTASLLVARAAWEADTGVQSLARQSSIAKLYATDEAQKVIDDVVQLFGALGIVKGSIAERIYRQIRLLRIYEGTSEVQKLIIAGVFGTSA